MKTLTSIENKCLLVRSQVKEKSVSSFVKAMQKYFPDDFDDIVFTSHAIWSVEREHSALPPQVISQAIHDFIRLRYIKDPAIVFKSVLDKYREDPTTYRDVQALIQDANIVLRAGTAAIVQLAYMRHGIDIRHFPVSIKTYVDIYDLVIRPATETCRTLNHYVVCGLDREVVSRPGCLIECGTIPVLTESAIWLISFSEVSSDHRLRLLALYLMMGTPPFIKQLAVINPHGGTYSTIDVNGIPDYHLETLRECLYGPQ